MGHYYDYAGVIHCHSHYSDGTGSVGDILQAARRCFLDFLIITDHDTILPREAMGEGWYKGVLLLFGQEISPPKNHYLALNLSSPINHQGLPPQKYIQAVNEQGGLGFIAHPHDRGNPFFGIPAFPWEDFSLVGYDGIEIWNYFTDLGNKMTGWLRSLRGLFFPRTLVQGPPAETLAVWDKLCQERRVVAIGGLDAHGIKISLAGIPVVLFSYRQLFRTVRTHILTPQPFTGNLPRDRRLLLDSLAQGHCYVSFDLLGDPRGFCFFLETPEGIVMMGNEANRTKKGWLKVVLPRRALVRLRHNGHRCTEKWCRQMEVKVEAKGVYRVEVFRGEGSRIYPWIFSNPIYIR